MALGDSENLPDYFDKQVFSNSDGLAFYNAVLNKHIKLLYVKDIKYHFLQVPGWLFEVEYFQRPLLNAGWLINSLRKANRSEKAAFHMQLLGE